jgi:hypothetical protein
MTKYKNGEWKWTKYGESCRCNLRIPEIQVPGSEGI